MTQFGRSGREPDWLGDPFPCEGCGSPDVAHADQHRRSESQAVTWWCNTCASDCRPDGHLLARCDLHWVDEDAHA